MSDKFHVNKQISKINKNYLLNHKLIMSSLNLTLLSCIISNNYHANTSACKFNQPTLQYDRRIWEELIIHSLTCNL